MTQTPFLDKIKKNQDESNVIGRFLEWLKTTDTVIASLESDDEGREYLTEIYLDIEHLLAQYYGIDLRKAEEERVKILDEYRTMRGIQ